MTSPLPAGEAPRVRRCLRSSTRRGRRTGRSRPCASPTAASPARRRDEVVASLVGDVVDDWLAPDSRWLARAVALLPARHRFLGADDPPRAADHARRRCARQALADIVAARGGRAARSGADPARPARQPSRPGGDPGRPLARRRLRRPPQGRPRRSRSFRRCSRRRSPRAIPSSPPAWRRSTGRAATAAARTSRWRPPIWWSRPAMTDSIADLAGRTRGRFIGHGHRISFAVVAAGRRSTPSDSGGWRSPATSRSGTSAAACRRSSASSRAASTTRALSPAAITRRLARWRELLPAATTELRRPPRCPPLPR